MKLKIELAYLCIQQFDLNGFLMSPCANEKVEISLDVTGLLKSITTLGSIQSLPTIALNLVSVVAIQPKVVLEDCSLLTTNQETILSEWLTTDAKLKSP